MIWKGLKFGMLLQFAVGPMCLLVFQTSASLGLYQGLLLVLSIALVDAVYIALSGIGAAAILRKKEIQMVIKVIGALILVLFGADLLAGAFHLSILPSISLFKAVSTDHIFLKGILLTASNPLTILFWSGVFTTQVIENHYHKKQLAGFGTGCVLATLLFLTLVALLGTTLRTFFSEPIIQILNACIGALLIFFGIRLLLKKTAE